MLTASCGKRHQCSVAVKNGVSDPWARSGVSYAAARDSRDQRKGSMTMETALLSLPGIVRNRDSVSQKMMFY